MSDLSLVRFRNHDQTHLILRPGVTLFLGPNGQGKTNIVEALVYLSFLSSHRVSTDAPLIQQGHASASLAATIHHNARQVTLGLTLNHKGSNKAEVNGNPSPLREMSSWLKVVIFSPEDLALVRGEPTGRRRFLDQNLALQSPQLSATLAEYERLVRQRNALLKLMRSRRGSLEDETTLQVWTEALIPHAAVISHARLQWMALIRPLVHTHYERIAPGNMSDLAWAPAESQLLNSTALRSVEDFHEAYRFGFTELREAERDRGQTLLGPHRDDVEVVLNGLPARTHASQGEAWSLALSLRLATADYWRDHSVSGDPIVILDDVFSELDQTRRDALARHVVDFEQVLITAAVTSDIPHVLTGRRYRVERGEVGDDTASGTRTLDE